MADPIQSQAPNAPAPAPVPLASQPGPPPAAPPSPPAAKTAALFGGLRGGRARKDGLVPGSPEALAADREKDRIRKERQRDRERAAKADPAPLPSAPPGAVQAPAPDLAGQPGAEAPAAPAVPWEPQTLKPIFDQLLPTVEQLTVNQVTSRAHKAKLPVELVEEIEHDAKWNGAAKKALEISCPQVAAKWLNKSGISAENQAEVVLGTAIASILASHMMLLRRMDKLIAVANIPAAKPAEEKKP